MKPINTNQTKKKRRGKPSAYSFSQINLFEKCRLSYYLKYSVDLPLVSSKFMTWGSQVHKALEGEKVENPAIPLEPYVKAVKEFYKKKKDKVEKNEFEFQTKIFGRKVRGFIDALTVNGYADDYKITSKPSSYSNMTSYQLYLYRFVAKQLGLGDFVPRYVLLKRDANGNFMSLTDHEEEVSKKKDEEVAKYLSDILDDMDRCWETGIWRFNPHANCYFCDAKKRCQYYGGK